MSRLRILGVSVVLLACLLLLRGGAARSAPVAPKDAGTPTATSKEAGGAGQNEHPENKKEGGCPPGMSYLPAATFTMGSNDKKNKKYWLQAEDEPEWPWLDEPVHKVSLDAFCMDITEVTVPAYRACVQSGKCAELPKPYCSWHKPHSDDHPQDCATWADADQFCRVVGKRLPTEEEWEYGARGTDGRRYPWGNSDPHSDTHSGGYREFCRRRPGDIPCPVGQFKRFASPFGLLDMTGNLEEWTSSDYCASDKRCGKIVRGSGGPTISEMRGAHRSSAWATDSGSLLGFRCALSL